MPALQHFFDAERKRQGWSMRETARRCKISLSKAYAIVNGDDNVEFDTFENIATAFSMSPAELATAIGKGAASDDPKRVPIHAALRDVADEHLSTIDRIVRGFHAVPATTEGITKPRRTFGRPKKDIVQQPLRRKTYQSQSLATQISQWGLQSSLS